MEQFLEAPVGDIEEGTHPLHSGGIDTVPVGEMIDEEAIPLVGGDTPRRRVRLHQIALLFEHGHLVADGGRTHGHASQCRNVAGTHGLRSGDVLLHDRPQDGCLAFVKHGGGLRDVSVQASERWPAAVGIAATPPRVRRHDRRWAPGRRRAG